MSTSGEQTLAPARQVRPEGRLLAIDALRGVAVLAVLTVHLPFSWSIALPLDRPAATALAFPEAVTNLTEYGRFGVHLFLVISGFCIHMRWARSPRSGGIDFVSFWRRRLTRLYPPYFAALAASVAGLLFAFGVMSHATSVAGAFGYQTLSQLGADLVSLVLLLQNLGDASQRIGNGPFWTLALEEQLYLLYFLLLLGRRRLGWKWTLAGVASVTFAWRVAPLLLPSLPGHWLALGPARWIEWAFGALAVESYLGLVRLPAWCSSLGVALASIAVAAVINWPGLLSADVVSIVGDGAFGFAFFALVNLFVKLDRGGALRRRAVAIVLADVGVFSYSLYLTQEPVVAGTKQLLLHVGLAVGAWEALVMIAARFAVAILVAYAFHRIVERPFIEISRRIGGGRPAQN